MKVAKSLWLFFFAMAPLCIEAYSKKVDHQVVFDDLQSSYSKLQHQLSNSRCEIKTFEERLLNFELMLESLRDELHGNKEQQKEILQTRSQSLELRISSLEQLGKTLATDVKQVYHNFNETKLKLSEIDKNFSNLQTAVASLLEVFQEKDELKPTRYTVKNGDNLDKIAKAHRTTVQALKELNGLNTDKIIVGKTIKIPSKI